MIQSSNAATAFVSHNAPMLVSSSVTPNAVRGTRGTNVLIGQNNNSHHRHQTDIMSALNMNRGTEVEEEAAKPSIASTIETEFENQLIHEDEEFLKRDSTKTLETISDVSYTFESLATVLVCFR